MPRVRAERMRVLYGQHATSLWQYAMRLTGDRVKAERVVEATFLRAVERSGLVEQSAGAARAWMFATARDEAGLGGRAEHDGEGDAAEELPLTEEAVGDPPADLLPRLLTRTDPAPHRVRSAALTVAGFAAAGGAAFALTLIPVTPTGPSPNMPQGPSAPVTDQPMQPVEPGVMTGEVSVIGQEWGTRVDVTGHYPPPPGGGFGSDAAEYELVVTGNDGTARTLAEWTAVAGDTVTPSGSTELPMLWVERVDIRSATTDQVLLTATF